MQSYERAQACLNWIEKATWPSAGVSAWVTIPAQKKGPPYPEVTGYLIPTLIEWEKYDLAYQYADWLVKIQMPDGDWPGIDGRHKNFDTAMCLHGLRHIPKSRKIRRAIDRAEDYLALQIREDSAMKIGPHNEYSPFYTILACAAIGHRPNYWVSKLSDEEWPWVIPERMHYILYGLAGMIILGENVDKWLKDIAQLSQPLMFWYEKDWKSYLADARVDLCANAQAAILLKDRTYLSVVEAEQQSDGGILEHPGAKRCTSWTAKYYLDAVRCTREE